jgi:hypothetical protein
VALHADTVWELRTSGADTNGGGFKAGASGTDYSQQDAAQLSLTDLACADGSTTTLTSATGGFTTAMIGNLIQIASGTNFTAGFYEITARTDTNTVTIDRNPTTGSAASAGVGKVGGALATFSKLAGAMVSSNRAFIKGTTFTTSTTPTFSATGVTPSESVRFTRLTGYGTTRGDGIRAKLTLSAASIHGMTLSNSGWIVENIEIDGSSQSTSNGINTSANYVHIRNCKVYGTTGFAMALFGALGVAVDNDVGPNAGYGIYTGGQYHVSRNYLHANVSTGIRAGGTIEGNLVTGTSGGPGIDAISLVTVSHNTVYGSSGNGITFSVNFTGIEIKGNLLVQNGGYGIAFSAAGHPADPAYDGNAFYNNTSGTRGNMDSVSGMNAVTPYTNVLDVILTADPFVDKAGDDFRLNFVSGGGAQIRGTAPGTIAASTTNVCYPDFGALQHFEPPPAELADSSWVWPNRSLT